MKSKQKGYFKDLDKNTKEHQEMCLWFTTDKNAKYFIRFFLGDNALNLKTTLEKPVKSQSGFLYGYADVYMSYETDQSRKENVLIELKSSFSDFGEVLRQVRTYQEYLGNITKTCLIYSGLTNKSDENATQYFVSQKIYIASLEEVKDKIECDLGNKEGMVPAGNRSAELCGVYLMTKRKKWDLLFIVKHYDEYLECEVSDLVSTANYFDHQEKFWDILYGFDLSINKKKPVSIHPGHISIPCSVDLSYTPGETGYPKPVIERVHIKGKVMNLII